MKETLHKIADAALKECQKEGILLPGALPPLIFQVPRRGEHGDYSTNVALEIASSVGGKTHDLARAIISHISSAAGIITRVEIAGPGFINFFLSDDYWLDLLARLARLEDGQGPNRERVDLAELDLFAGERIQLEYVSANPTGPLHIGHGRGAAVGDALARILSACGCRVYREYYVNDIGTQMETLGRSVLLRTDLPETKGIEPPAEPYRGAYVGKLAEKLKADGSFLSEFPEYVRVKEAHDPRAEESLRGLILRAGVLAGQAMLEEIREDLALFRVVFDNFYRESSLYDQGKWKAVWEELNSKNLVYEKEGALWFRTQDFGDEKDRVVIRSNGATTYFASDVAYHLDKFQRGFERIIDIWGADHHGYIPRVRAALKATGYPEEAFQAVLVQMVSLVREGRPVAMSTRAGEFITLRQVLEEVGTDATRFFLLMRRADSHLEFDLDLAKRESAENPVYYVQYAHARIASILRKAQERGLTLAQEGVPLGCLKGKDDLALIKQICFFSEVVQAAAQLLEPHRLPFYLISLAGNFHRYYLNNRVLSQDRELTQARLFLVSVLKRVIKKGLDLMGVSAPERMEREEGDVPGEE